MQSATFVAVVTLVALVAVTTLPAQVQGVTTSSLSLFHFNVNGELADGLYLDIELGAPDATTGTPQLVSVLLDTGSPTLAVPPHNAQCYPGCPTTGDSGIKCVYPLCAPDAPRDSSNCVFGSYTPSRSSTSQPVLASNSACCDTCAYGASRPLQPASAQPACSFALGYGGSSETLCELQGNQGYWIQDTLKLGGMSATVTFGAITELEVNFQEAPCAGIMGVSPDGSQCLPATLAGYESAGNPGQSCFQNSLTTLLRANNASNQFGLCMGNANEPGTFVLGEPDTSLQAGMGAQATLDLGQGFYSVHVHEMTVNGRGIGLTRNEQTQLFQGAVLDSGTSFLSLPKDLLDALAVALTPCTTDDDCALEFSMQAPNGQPDTVIRAPYILTCQSSYCEPNQGWVIEGDSGDPAILGYIVLRNYYTTFERDTSQHDPARVTFAPPSHKCAAPLPPTGPHRKGSNSGTPTTTTKSNNLSTGAIIGIIIGIVILVVLFGLAAHHMYTQQQQNRHSQHISGGHHELLVASHQPHNEL